MKIEIYKGMEVDIFNMYGMVDIRAAGCNRIAQIFHDDKEWELQLHLTEEDGSFAIHYEILFFGDKADAVTGGKNWVVENKGGD